MACGDKLKNTLIRSIQTAYNNTPQAFTITGGTVSILGNQVCDTGCAIDTDPTGFEFKREGVYRISYDVLFEATGAGTAEIQLYNGVTPLPCSYSMFVAAAGGIYPMHVETIIPIRACCGYHPMITCQVTGAAGNVTHVCASAVKLV